MLGLALTRSGAPMAWWPPGCRYAVSFAMAQYVVDAANVPAGSAFTFGRPSTKRAQDLTGHWRLFQAGAMARTNLGALLEPASTNAIRNAVGEGAVPGSPGTFPTYWTRFSSGAPAISVIGSGVENGLPFVDVRLAGIASASSGAAIHFEQVGAIPALEGQSWTSSVWLRVVGGTAAGLMAVRLNMQEMNAGGSGLTTHYGVNLRDQLSAIGIRPVETRSLGQTGVASLRVSLELTYAQSADIDLTLRISAPQAEPMSSASSPILSTGSIGSRAADALTLTLPSGTHDLLLTYADGSTQWRMGVSGAYLLDPAALQRLPLASIVAVPR